jgi:hypothetical protein
VKMTRPRGPPDFTRDTRLADALAAQTEAEFAAVIDRYAPGFIAGYRTYLAVWRGDRRPGSVKVRRKNGRWYYNDYAEGSGGDLVAWLMDWGGLSFKEALDEIIGSGEYLSRPRTWAEARPKSPLVRGCLPEWVNSYHKSCVQRLHAGGIPSGLAVWQRGWTTDLATALGIGLDGEDVVYPVKAPDGTLKALKRRYAKPRVGGGRFEWIPSRPEDQNSYWGDWNTAKEVLIVEGEGKSVTLHMALGTLESRPLVACVGVAGTGGSLGETLRTGLATGMVSAPRQAYILPDAPRHVTRRGGEIVDVSMEAAQKWQAQAEAVGVPAVILPSLGDVCDVAHAIGLEALGLQVKEAIDARTKQ